ncbi:hypothetical protein V5O48_008343 [Marasmius crinis-equi]|uniref:Uncharacterized protein n=1 Tax=Marasmius crinis-equi TaxID=585013 RepID=A0ABR3FEA5_9AGAR
MSLLHFLANLISILKRVTITGVVNVYIRKLLRRLCLSFSLFTRSSLKRGKRSKKDGIINAGDGGDDPFSPLSEREEDLLCSGEGGIGHGNEIVFPKTGPSTESVIICASEIPSTLHPHAFNNPHSTISRDLRSSTSLRADFISKSQSYSRISYPTTSGQPYGTVSVNVSPAASASRLSVHTPSRRGQGETVSRYSPSPAPSSNIQAPSERNGQDDNRGSPATSTSRLSADPWQPQRHSHGETSAQRSGSPAALHVINIRKPTDEVGVLTDSPVETCFPHPEVPQLDHERIIAVAEVTSEPEAMEGYVVAPRGESGNDVTLRSVFGDFYPMAPESHWRYVREDYVEPFPKKCTLPAQTTVFQGERLPDGWKEFIHPEGARYFLFEAKHIYTDADVYDYRILSHVTRFMKEMDEYTERQGITYSGDVHIAFDVYYEPEKDGCACRYYIADHSTRSVFWLDPFEAHTLSVWEEVRGVERLTHIRHALEAQYWYHCGLFPDSFKLKTESVDELRDILIYWIGDVLTSRSSTIPYTLEELEPMLRLANNLRKNVGGQRGVAAYDLNKVSVDRIVYKGPWDKLILNMNIEWQKMILFGIVLLSVNLMFLTIGSIDQATAVRTRSIAQILSFLSVMSMIGSVILGLMLARKNKVKDTDGATEAACFILSFERQRLGLETLAILYSLPYALLMWGVIYFLGSFSFYCLHDTAFIIWLIFAGASTVVFCLVFWCIFSLASFDGRYSGEQMSAWDQLFTAMKDAFSGMIRMINRKLIALGLKNPDPEPQERSLTFDPRGLGRALRKASRKATSLSLSALGLGNRVHDDNRRVRGDVEDRPNQVATPSST